MGNLTELMELFEKKLLVIPDNLKPYALGILATLITIDLGLLAFQLGDIDIIKTLCKKVFKYGMITYFITEYSSLIKVPENPPKITPNSPKESPKIYLKKIRIPKFWSKIRMLFPYNTVGPFTKRV